MLLHSFRASGNIRAVCVCVCVRRDLDTVLSFCLWWCWH